MERNFTRWRDSLSSRHDDNSIVISGSDEDTVDSLREQPIINESNEDDDAGAREDIEDTTSKRKIHSKNMKKFRILDFDDSDHEETNVYEDEEYHTINDFHNSDSDSSVYSMVKNKDKKRKDVTHDKSKEDIKELKPNSSNSISGQNSDSEFAISFAKEEIGIRDVDPLIAQKRALTVCRLEQLKNESAQMKLLLSEGNIEVLPDKGQKIQKCIRQQEEEIETLTRELENTPLVPLSSNRETETKKTSPSVKEDSWFVKDELYSDDTDYLYSDIDNISKCTTSHEKKLGKTAQATRDQEFALTVERLQDLHGSLIARPSDNEKVEDPRGLKVQLMPHQQYALAWLLWREQQRPSGGVLADDMGLGKTLTMIGLIMITLAKNDPDEESNSDEKRNSKDKPLHPKGGTLIVCPASLLSQWENEVANRCECGLLSVRVHHGSTRQNIPKTLAKYNMVITTYNILAREYKTNSTLFKINWKRVILDEAHIVRNHKSQASEAVCGLIASKRWALTGTPIQNKELDLYSILKFLKCSPFDDLRVWKRWVDNKNAAGHQRLAMIMKTLMLRRTKQELIANGDLGNLPDKSIEEVMVQLDHQEKLVYEKILIYSRTLFAQFLAQRAEKAHMIDLYGGKYDKPTYFQNPNKSTQFTKAQNKLLALHADVKSHEILMLLLRLRQVCCHPALIHAMLDQEDMKQSGIMENVDINLLSRVNNMSLNEIDNAEEEDIGIDQGITENLLTAENPVFDNDRISSKMKMLLNMVEEILQKGDDKLIIISQWSSLLEIIASHLSSIEGATFDKFTGKVAIKDRHEIIESFNSHNSGPRILLLSLTAGGVGLNLVGANHLLLFDIHWNPQLETQAQDRIYRFGQTKNVYIYKFICVNTIEERIKTLQERKLDIARNVLSGDGSNTATKLTLNDLKSLFGF